MESYLRLHRDNPILDTGINSLIQYKLFLRRAAGVILIHGSYKMVDCIYARDTLRAASLSNQRF